MRRSGILMAFERLKVGRGLAVVALLVLLVPYVYLRGIADDFRSPVIHFTIMPADLDVHFPDFKFSLLTGILQGLVDLGGGY